MAAARRSRSGRPSSAPLASRAEPRRITSVSPGGSSARRTRPARHADQRERRIGSCRRSCSRPSDEPCCHHDAGPRESSDHPKRQRVPLRPLGRVTGDETDFLDENEQQAGDEYDRSADPARTAVSAPATSRPTSPLQSAEPRVSGIRVKRASRRTTMMALLNTILPVPSRGRTRCRCRARPSTEGRTRRALFREARRKRRPRANREAPRGSPPCATIHPGERPIAHPRGGERTARNAASASSATIMKYLNLRSILAYVPFTAGS